MLKKLIILCLGCLSLSLRAETNFEQPLSVAELVNIALETHPETQKIWWNARKAAASLEIAKSGNYPKIDFTSSVNHGREFKYINGPDVNYTVAKGDITLDYVLYDFGKTNATIEATKKALQAANWQSDYTLQKVIAQVFEGAYSTIHAQEAVQAALISQNEAEKMLELVQERNKAGLCSITDLYLSQASLGQMKMETIQQKTQLEIQRAKLAVNLGVNADVAVLVRNEVVTILPQDIQTSQLIEISKKQRADLAAKRLQLEQSSYLEEAVRLKNKPNISLSGRGGGEYAFHTKEQGTHYDIGLRLDIPLFDGFSNTYEKLSAYADTQITGAELAQLELDIIFQVVEQSRLLSSLQEMIPLADDVLKNSEAAFEGILEKYKSGKESFENLSLSLKQLAAARLRYSDVKTKWFIAMANLAYAVGNLSPYLETSCVDKP